MLFIPLLSLFLLGPIVGIISTFFGVGGGVLIVPCLYMLFPQMPPTTVISCSLGSIFINSVVNTYNFVKIGRKPSFLLALLLSLFLALGVIVGSYLAPGMSASDIKTILGGVLILLGIRFLFLSAPPVPSVQWIPQLSRGEKSLIAVVSLFGGILSGITGLGGGIVLVPILIFVAKTPLNWIGPYLNVAMGVGSFCGILSYVIQSPPTNYFLGHPLESWQLGHLNIGISLILSLGAMLTSRWGSRLAQGLNPKTTKRWFTFLLFLFALQIFLKK